MYHLRRGNVRLLAGVVACAIFTAALPGAPAPTTPPPPAKVEGKFNVKIGGYYQGNGNAAVSASSLSISAEVADETGQSSDFVIAGVTVDPTNHFIGSGMIAGKSLSITGRLDPVDVAETQLKTARITANFTVSDGHRGRVAGFVPIDPGSTDPTTPPTPPSPPTSPTSPGLPPPKAPPTVPPTVPTPPNPTKPTKPTKPQPTKPNPTKPTPPVTPPGDDAAGKDN